jgi:hypothetical protein
VQAVVLALIDLREELLELDPNVRLAYYLPAVGLWQIFDLA